MSDQLGVALVGCGRIARSHAAALTQVPNARRLVAVDVDEAAARDFQDRFDFAEASTELAAVLARDDVHAVVITTSTASHAALSVQALEAGKHVLVQKPMATSEAEAAQVVEAARRADRKLMVSFFELFLPAVEKAKAIIDAGLIGTPFLFKAMMAWYTPDSALGWRFDPKTAGGGVMSDGNVHHVANALYLLGSPKVRSVFAEYGGLTTQTGTEDTGVIIMRTDNAICEISGSNRLLEPGGVVEAFKDTWQVFGTKGTIHWDAATRPTMRVYSTDERCGNDLLGRGWTYPRLPITPEGQRAFSMHLNGDESPWVPEHQHFVNQCLRGGAVRSDGEFGLITQRVLEAAYRSGQEGRRIDL